MTALAAVGPPLPAGAGSLPDAAGPLAHGTGSLAHGTDPLAHGTDPLAHSAATGAEIWEILSVVVLALLAAAYGRGVHELWLRRGIGAVVPRWRAAAFATGLVTLLAAQHGPMHRLAEGSLTGHMAQHMLLLVVAGPLLAAGAAGLPVSLACPSPLRRRVTAWRVGRAARWLRRPGIAVVLVGTVQVVVLWVWHLPVPYATAVAHPMVHAGQHASFVLAAWLLWAPVLGGSRHRPAAPVALLPLFAAMLSASALGAALTFAPAPVYPPSVLAPGGDPLTDQQLAGLVMWVPMDVAVLVAVLAAFLRWFQRLNQPAGRGGIRADDLPAAVDGVMR